MAVEQSALHWHGFKEVNKDSSSQMLGSWPADCFALRRRLRSSGWAKRAHFYRVTHVTKDLAKFTLFADYTHLAHDHHFHIPQLWLHGCLQKHAPWLFSTIICRSNLKSLSQSTCCLSWSLSSPLILVVVSGLQAAMCQISLPDAGSIIWTTLHLPCTSYCRKVTPFLANALMGRVLGHPCNFDILCI